MNDWCPMCFGTGKCPICGNYQESKLKQVYRVIDSIELEIFDMTHETGKLGIKKIPKFVMIESLDKVRHVSSLKHVLEDLKEIVE